MIGAGYAGLAAATRCRDAGRSVLVLEAGERVGGRARSERLANGAIAELGGEWLFAGDDELFALARRFFLELVEMGCDFARREAVDISAPLEEQDVVLARLGTMLAAGIPEMPPTLGGFLAREPDSPALAALRARFTGTCAIELDRVALAAADGLLSPGGAGTAWRLAAGNQALADAMAAQLEVRLGAYVVGVESLGDGVRVQVAGSQPVEAGGAIIAVPLPLLRELMFEPPLPSDLQAAVDALGFGVAAKLAVPVERALEPRARQSVAGPFWWWVGAGEEGALRAVVTSYAGSPRALADLETRSGDPASWLGRLSALDGDVVPVAPAILVDWSTEPFARGAYTAIPPGAASLMPALAEPVGRIVLAGEHTAGVERHGTLEGALRSGGRAAAQALAIVQP